MKGLLTLAPWLMMVICLSLTTACSNNDDDEISADNPLLGTWICKDAASGVEDIITFKANGSCEMTLKYVYEGTDVVIKINATYIYEDDIITIIPEKGNRSSWKVESITTQQLVLIQTDVEEQTSVIYRRA